MLWTKTAEVKLRSIEAEFGIQNPEIFFFLGKSTKISVFSIFSKPTTETLNFFGLKSEKFSLMKFIDKSKDSEPIGRSPNLSPNSAKFSKNFPLNPKFF